MERRLFKVLNAILDISAGMNEFGFPLAISSLSIDVESQNDRIDVKMYSFQRNLHSFRLCEELDLKRHRYGTEVKAVTYGGMKVKEELYGYYSAYVILDI